MGTSQAVMLGHSVYQVIRRIILFLITAGSLTCAASAQWVQTNGPPGSGLASFVYQNGNTYACAGGGIFRSSDDGLNWTVLGYASPGDVTSLTSDGSRLFAGTKIGDLLVSSDSGESWLSIRHDLPASPVRGILARQDTLLVILGQDSIYRSIDGGMHWRPSGSSGERPGPFIYELVCRGRYVLAGGYNGIFRSSNMGLSWTRSNDGLADTSIHALAFKDSLVFAGTLSEGVYISTDLGLSWNATAPPPQSIYGVWSIISSWGTIYVATMDGVCASTDNGNSWSTVSTGLPAGHDRVVWELFSTPMTIIARTTRGQFRSTNGGAMWNPSNAGEWSSTVYALYESAEGILAGTQYMGAFVMKDHGASWLPRNTGILENVVHGNIYAFAEYGGYVFAGTENDAYRSSDHGDTWSRVRLSTGNVTAFAVRDSVLFASATAVSRSTDSGKTWQRAYSGLTDGIDAFLVRGKTVIAGSNWSGIARTTNDGDSWIRSSDLQYIGINCLLSTDATCFAGTYGKGVYISSDDGEHWVPTVSSPGNLYVWALASANGMVFAGTQKGIYSSSDLGESWTNVSSPGVNCPIFALIASGGYLYAGTSERSVWRRSLDELTASVESPNVEQPLSLSLDQNFPNPFNASTTIQYSLNRRSRVVMTVINVLGVTVETLLENTQEAGIHSVRWNASHSPSGVYFLRLRSDVGVAIRKIILLK